VIGAAEPCYFGPEDERLFGWYHPAAETRGPGLVICPPLFQEMIAAHRSLRHLAEEAAAAGLPSLRFDYHGSGDSAGSDLDPHRLAAWLASIRVACDTLRRASGVGSLVLVGVRLGAPLAALAALERYDVAGLVLWAPVASGRGFLRETGALARLTERDDMLAGLPEGAASASGFVLTPETVRDLGSLDISRIERRPARRILVVPHEDAPGAEATAGALAGRGAEVEERELPGLSAMLRLPHEATVPVEVIRATIEWARAREQPDAVTPDAVATSARPIRLVREGCPAGAECMRLPGDLEERAFVIGDRLFGILTQPTMPTSPRRPTIVLANAGAAYRIGVNRLYVTFARAWASLGFPVLRLDLGGLGDSLPAPGVAENEPYSAQAVNDLSQAAAALRDELGVGSVVVGGICSGAHAAFHAARQLPGITGVLMLNPVVFYWRPGDSLELADWRTYSELRDYGRRLARLETWRRLWRGEIRAGESVRSLAFRVAQAVRTLTRVGVRGSDAGDDAGRDLLRMCQDGKDVLLLFSDGEPGLDYLRYNHAGDLRRLSRCPGFRLEVIGTPGHNYPSVRAQRDVLERTTGHLLQHYGAA
jgi:pimeloyl-ACP methyl ester carboxylesterase